jgi:L-asparaginase
MSIRVFVTGSTFDKEYDEIRGTLSFQDTHLPAMLEKGRSRLDVSVRTIMMVDNLDRTDEDRMLIARNCQGAEEDQVVITHGTDNMVDTADHRVGIRRLASNARRSGSRRHTHAGARSLARLAERGSS